MTWILPSRLLLIGAMFGAIFILARAMSYSNTLYADRRGREASALLGCHSTVATAAFQVKHVAYVRHTFPVVVYDRIHEHQEPA